MAMLNFMQKTIPRKRTPEWDEAVHDLLPLVARYLGFDYRKMTIGQCFRCIVVAEDAMLALSNDCDNKMLPSFLDWN